jgi:hypothetical protein
LQRGERGQTQCREKKDARVGAGFQKSSMAAG